MGQGDYTPPQSPWPRPKGVLVVRPGRLPRQSYPPQTGCFKLPILDSLTQYLTMLAQDEMWDEWDYAWSRLKYLPRWDMTCIWEGPPGWITPHAFLAWSTWHMSVAFQWLHRLWKAGQRSHSPEALLSDERPLNPVYFFLNQQQVNRARNDTYKAMRMLGAGDYMYRPTPELVIYRPDGLHQFLDTIKASEDIGEFEWHESRSRHKAELFMREAPEMLNTSAKLLKQHLGETGWQE